MKEKMIYIETQDYNYPMVFNLNVMESIQEEYGTMSAWGDKTSNNDGEPNIKALKFGLVAMINEGLEIESEKENKELHLIDTKKVGRIISEVGMETITKKLQETVVNSTKTGEEQKNI